MPNWISFALNIGGVVVGLLGLLLGFFSVMPNFGRTSRYDELYGCLGPMMALAGAVAYIVSFFL